MKNNQSKIAITHFSYVRPLVELVRIIRDESPNQYMALYRFKDEVMIFSQGQGSLNVLPRQEAAKKFKKTFNGKRFNSFEDKV